MCITVMRILLDVYVLLIVIRDVYLRQTLHDYLERLIKTNKD